MDDVEDGRLHLRRLQVLVRAQVEMPQRFPEQLGLVYVDGDELQDAVLGDDADDHGPSGLVIDVDQGYTAGSSLQHASTCFVERLPGMDGRRLEW